MIMGSGLANGRDGVRGAVGSMRRRAGLVVLALAVMLGVVAVTGPAARAETAPVSQSAQGEIDPAVRALAETMQIEAVLGIMRDEGLDYARGLEADMFPGRGGADWLAEVERVYDRDRMREEFLAGLTSALAGKPELARMQDFFAADLGQRIVGLELEARRALLDDAAEDAARMAWMDVDAQDGPRREQIEEFVTVNDLMESNITGAMNANLAFYRGLMAVAPAELGLVEADILASVAGQQDQIRADTEDWLYPYLTLAYAPLSTEELAQYIDFSKSEAGQRLNRALFAAFAVMFDRLSHDLGAATGRRMQGQDI